MGYGSATKAAAVDLSDYAKIADVERLQTRLPASAIYYNPAAVTINEGYTVQLPLDKQGGGDSRLNSAGELEYSSPVYLIVCAQMRNGNSGAKGEFVELSVEVRDSAPDPGFFVQTLAVTEIGERMTTAYRITGAISLQASSLNTYKLRFRLKSFDERYLLYRDNLRLELCEIALPGSNFGGLR